MRRHPVRIRSKCLVGCSLNIEYSFSHRLQSQWAEQHGIVLTEKNEVRHIARSFGDKGTIYQVTKMDGQYLEIVAPADTEVRERPAGSSFNVAKGLHRLSNGAVRPTLLGFAGVDPAADFLSESFRRMHMGFELLMASGTARTLSIRDPLTGKATLLCEKPPYEVTPDLLKICRDARMDTLIMTGVKAQDVSITEALYEASMRIQKSGLRVLMPHPSLLRNGEYRERLCRLAQQSSVFQVNAHEAGLLLGQPFGRESLPELSHLLQTPLIIVTCSNKGAFLYTDGNVIEQPSLPAQPRDMTGAGDSHLAAFLYHHYVCHESLELSLHMAAWVAARKVETIGSWAGIPTAVEAEMELDRLHRHAA